MKLLNLKAWKSAFVEKKNDARLDAGVAMTPLVVAPAVVEVAAKRANVDAVARMLREIEMPDVDVERALDGVDAGDVVATYTMSTDVVDRPGDRIDQTGWDLSEFRSNPVMLFGHDANSPPVGKALGAAVVAGALRGTFKFTPESVYAFGATVGRLVKGGFLSAGSVGFMPVDVRVAEDRINPDDAWSRLQPPLDFVKSKLLEFSAVPIPANPEALVDAKSIGNADLAVVRAWAERVLAGEGDRVVVLPRATVERMAKIGKRSSLVFDVGGVGGLDVKLAEMPPIEISVEVSVGEEPSIEGEPVSEEGEPVSGEGEPVSGEGEPVMGFDEETMAMCPSCGYSAKASEFPPSNEPGTLVCKKCGHVDKAEAFVQPSTKSMKAYESIDFSPPEGVREACAQGVEWYDEGKGGDGLVEETIAWAKKLAAGDPITPEKVRLMNAWLARHAVDLDAEGAKPGDDGYPSPGRVAWALWGGDAAVPWSAKLVAAMDAEDSASAEESAAASAALPNGSKGWHSDFASPQALRAFVDEVTKVAVEKAILATTGRLPD
jgi:hypothetical protein